MAHILLVDDEQAVLTSISMLLQADGHDVSAYADGQAVLDAIDEGIEADLLITDIRMSPVDGQQVILRAREVRPTIPVIVISAYGSEKTVTEFMALGCSAYIKKPFKVDEVIAAAREALAAS